MAVLVLGVGNLLLQDEGVGIHVVREFQQRFQLPPEVTVLDGGTSGMALLDDLMDKQQLIIIDAVKSDAPPGTLIRLVDEQIPSFFRTVVSPHQLGIADILAQLTLLDAKPAHMVLIGIVPETTELGLTLSSAVADQMNAIIDALAAELGALGLAPIPNP